MGTRSLTVLHDGDIDSPEIAVMYRQFDGYPEGHGVDLCTFLSDIALVNGMGMGDPPRIANGMDCLAAQIVASFKQEPGGIYLMPAGTRDAGEEYIYHVYSGGGRRVYVRAFAVYDENKGEPFYDGPAADFPWPKSAEEEVAGG